MLSAIIKLIRALNGYEKGSQIASGFAWGILLGLVPAGNIFFIVLFLFSFFFKHNYWSKLLVLAVIKLLSPIIVYKLDELGWYILHIDELQPIFISLYNMPFVPFTKFNNTLVISGLVSGIVLWLPVFILFLFLIPLYRKYVVSKIGNSRFVKKLVKLPFFATINKALSPVNRSAE